MATATFLEINEVAVTHVGNDDVYDSVMEVAAEHADVGEIAATLRRLAAR